jgi:thermitase
MDGAIDMARSKDFVDTTSTSAANAEGLHGLGTGSVIVSRDNRANRAKSVTGIAPAATLIPYRVAKKRFFVPVPVLFRSGMRRLRLALLAAIEEGCHVVSISLGWLRNEGVHRALRQAVDKDIIVCAAAGNYTSSLVVWPAAYEEAIALAACNVRREAWAGSAHGPKVDVTAPGEDVWRAVPGDEYVAPSSGTSYAAAITAGLAALWLAFHGREAVLLRARALGINAAELFRRYLRATASEGPGDGFGRGIVDARALLDKAIDADDLECFEVAASSKVPETPSTLLESAFDLLPPEEVRRRAAGLLSVPAAELPERIAGRETEVLAALILDLAARRAMTAPLGATTKALESFEAKDLPLSNTLRAQLYAAG